VRAGFFPLDEQLELCDAHWSLEVVRLSVWLSGLLPFGQAAAVLQKLGALEVTASSLWRRAQQWGAKMGEASARQRVQANALSAAWDVPEAHTGAYAEAHTVGAKGESGIPRRMGVSMDGAMVNIRNEEWKELKFGCVFEVAVRKERDPLTHEAVPVGHAAETTCVAHLGGPETLGEMVWAEAHRRRWEEAQDTIAIADGASWIWNQVALHFGDSLQLVDWYHARSHLCDAASLLHPDGSPAHQRWLRAHTTALYQGHAAIIAQELTAAAAAQPERSDAFAKAATYFQTHAHRMNYLELREALWPIGSGVVESTAKQFKQRLCGPGMRWSRTGASHMATLRSAIISRRFDACWRNARAIPQN
jgi:hypothetical protein